MIEVRELTKKYGDHTAVDHLSFTVEPGRIYGFLGPNGAGKSTTMNMMTGYLSPTEGEIYINGHSMIEEPEEAKRYIGYLPELPPVYPDMTVQEYVRFAAELKKVPREKRAEQVERAIRMARLEEMRSRLIRNLSKGYKQRVGLAQAIVSFPEIIILDEPTVGLDPKQIIEMRQVMKDLAKDHTVILSSHIMQEISAVCDHVLIINHGKLVANDTIEALEENLAGDNELSFTVEGTEEQVRRLLGAFPQIRSLTFSGVNDQVTADLVLEPGADIRRDLFRALAQADLPLLALQARRKSLEDVFLELTQEEPETSGDAKEEA